MKFQGYLSSLAAALSMKNGTQLAYLLAPDLSTGQKKQMVSSLEDCSVRLISGPLLLLASRVLALILCLMVKAGVYAEI